MKYKNIRTLIITTILMVISAIIVSGETGYEVYKSNVKILFDEKEMNFDEPVVTINDKTYVPLREMVEQTNMQLEWDENEQKIMLSEMSNKNEAKQIFFELFGKELPTTSKIVDYDYHIESDEKYFVSKIYFEKKDLEHVENCCSEFSISSSSLEKIRKGIIPFNYYANKYKWWDLVELTDETEVYHGFKTGVYKKSIPIWMFITEKNSDECYLYVIYG